MVNFKNIKKNLVQGEIRKKIKIGKETVEIYNITAEAVEEVYNHLAEYYDEETQEFAIETTEAIAYIYKTFTNINVEEPNDLLEALKTPNSKLKDIQREITRGMIDVVNNFLKDRLVDIEGIELAISAQDMKNKSETLLANYSPQKEK